MSTSAVVARADYSSPLDVVHTPNEAAASAVSWAAVAAGAFVTAAISLILLALGAGASLSSLSPFSTSGVSTSTVGLGALVWVGVVELLSCLLGGYVAGRLRTKWVNVHSDEVYFRDTAHGFLVWAVALVITAAFLTSAASAMVGSEPRPANSPRTEAAITDANRYFIDTLFRGEKEAPATEPIVTEAQRTEVGIIFARSLRERALAPEDKTYVANVVSAHTGLNNSEAAARVDDVFARDQQAADAARKAIAHSLYWLFVALLLGAFAASFAATFGGKQRDHMHSLRPA